MKKHPFAIGFVLGIAAVWIYHTVAGPHLPGSSKG